LGFSSEKVSETFRLGSVKMIFCPKCGYKNDEDAAFCENCGENLRSKSENGSTVSGMKTSTKLLIGLCIVLIAGLGVTSGFLLQMNGAKANPTSSVNQSAAQVTYKASWHEVTSFTGAADDMRSFNTQGKQFKVVMSATPLLNYNVNSMSMDISDSNNNLLTSGSLEWEPTEALSEKQKTIEVTGQPGTYYLNIYSNELENWTVKVYDYY